MLLVVEVGILGLEVGRRGLRNTGTAELGKSIAPTPRGVSCHREMLVPSKILVSRKRPRGGQTTHGYGEILSSPDVFSITIAGRNKEGPGGLGVIYIPIQHHNLQVRMHRIKLPDKIDPA